MEENILVSVRARPLNDREKIAGEYVSWDLDIDNNLVTSIPETQNNNNNNNNNFDDDTPFSKNDRRDRIHEYSFDHVFEPSATTQDVYNNVAQGIVWSSMEGFNGTIFAYGQTGSGKTFTMKGTGRKQPGILNLAIHDVWGYIQQHPEREFLLRVSYMEIYNEIVNDLLTPGNTNLKIHEDPVKGIYVGNLKEEIVVSPTHVMALLAGGDVHRHVGATNFNDQSSRSHTLFRIVIESKLVGGTNPLSPEPPARAGTPTNTTTNSSTTNKAKFANNDSPVRASSLTLIDLAGSERSSVGVSGLRQREGSHINQSLLTLGIIVAKLADKKNAGHIPWRDSKLTRILHPSLGGNARVAIISTITLANGNMEETLSTLKFATRAKKVKNTAKVNELVEEKGLLRFYRNEIASLKSELAKALANEKTLTTSDVPEEGNHKKDEEKRKMELDNEAMLKKMTELEKTRAALERGFANSSEDYDDDPNYPPMNSSNFGTSPPTSRNSRLNGHTEYSTPITARVKSSTAAATNNSPTTRISHLHALIEQLHSELKSKDEVHATLRSQVENAQNALLEAKQQILRLQEEAIQRQKGDEWLILQQVLKEERTRATIYASADAEFRTELGRAEAARACLELDVKVAEKERALLAAHSKSKDLRIAELEVEVQEMKLKLRDEVKELRLRNENLERDRNEMLTREQRRRASYSLPSSPM